jgi:hypothetical protein
MTRRRRPISVLVLVAIVLAAIVALGECRPGAAQRWARHEADPLPERRWSAKRPRVATDATALASWAARQRCAVDPARPIEASHEAQPSGERR